MSETKNKLKPIKQKHNRNLSYKLIIKLIINKYLTRRFIYETIREYGKGQFKY